MATTGDIVTGVLLSELAVDDDSMMCEEMNKRHFLIHNFLQKKKQNRKKLLFHLAHVAGRKKRQGPPVRRFRMGRGKETDASLDHDYANGSVPRFCSDEFDEFKAHFPIRRSTFNKIVSLVEPKFGNQEKSSLPIQRKVLVSMWMLSCQDSFKTIGDKFGLQKSTTYYAFTQFVGVLHGLAKQYIFWPDSDRLNGIAEEFQKKYSFPGVLGVISTCRIPIKIPPAEEKTGEARADPYSTMVLQAVCDHRMKFMDIHPSSPQPDQAPTSNWRLFESSHLGRHLCTNEWEVPDGYYLVGDGSYALRKYLMTPYENPASEEQTRVNGALASMAAVIRKALGSMQSRFARLKYIDASRSDLVPLMVVAACVLHNIILEEEGEPLADVEEKGKGDRGPGQFLPATGSSVPATPSVRTTELCSDQEAIRMRDAIAKTLVVE